jgi:hypothetical protein
MRKITLVFLAFVSALFLTGCSSEPKAIEQFYEALYSDVTPQLDDGYTEAQLEALRGDVKNTREYFSISYRKVDGLIQNLKTKAELALSEASVDEEETLREIIKMYESYSIESQQAVRLLDDYDKECPDAASRPSGTLPSRACGGIFFNAVDLKEVSLVCVYYVSAKFLEGFPGFDKTKVLLLNSEISEDAITQGCEAFRQSASLLGYPHRTSRWEVPEKMQREVDSEIVIAVADGLYTNVVSGVPILEQAVYGTWFGYCSAFSNMEAKLPAQIKSGNCW